MNAPELRHSPLLKKQLEYNIHPKNNLYIITDQTYDVANLGMIMRISDALNAREVIFCGDCELPTNLRIRKSSVHLADIVNWSHCYRTVDAVKSLRTNGIKIFGLDLDPRAINYTEAKFDKTLGCAIVLGNESRGIQPKVLDMCDEIISIPMYGVNKSMNVSMALSVAGFRLLEGNL
jgi:tRNA G18 (ribose-2'-O)-methylase SpoU